MFLTLASRCTMYSQTPCPFGLNLVWGIPAIVLLDILALWLVSFIKPLNTVISNLRSPANQRCHPFVRCTVKQRGLVRAHQSEGCRQVAWLDAGVARVCRWLLGQKPNRAPFPSCSCYSRPFIFSRFFKQFIVGDEKATLQFLSIVKLEAGCSPGECLLEF